MARNTSVSLENYFEDFAENRTNKVIALRIAIREGIANGIIKSFNAKKHLETLKANKRLG